MKRLHCSVLFAPLLLLAGCGQRDKDSSSGSNPAPGESGQTLVEARKGFQTKLVRPEPPKEPVEEPPAKLFRTVRYDSPVGKLQAYLAPDPKDGRKHPAMIWITGGDCNSIGDVWSPQPAKNDQSAVQYRQAGAILMFPSLRGGNDNPGRREGFLGEVDDVLAAADFLAKQPYIDPNRIYLGGHSTGGTLSLLVAECSGRFRAVFSFGPADDPANYGPDNEFTPFDFTNPRELSLRSPGRWLASVSSPTFVFEGQNGGNTDSLNQMSQSNRNPAVQFFPVAGADHFSVLAPVNRLVASKLMKDDGPKCNLAFTAEEVNAAMRKR